MIRIPGVLFSMALVSTLVGCAGHTHAERETAATPSVPAVAATAEVGEIECRTPDVADSGYTVKMMLAENKTFRGTVAGVAVWGTEKPTYEGIFNVEVSRKAGKCQAQFKANSGLVISTEALTKKSIPSLTSKSTMTFKSGGTTHPLVCKLTPAVTEQLQKCQASL